MSFLEIQEVFSGYGAGDILQGVSLRMERSEMTNIIGPNGAG